MYSYYKNEKNGVPQPQVNNLPIKAEKKAKHERLADFYEDMISKNTLPVNDKNPVTKKPIVGKQTKYSGKTEVKNEAEARYYVSVDDRNREIANSYKFDTFNPVKELESVKNFSATITSSRRSGKSVLLKDFLSKIHKWYTNMYIFSHTSDYQKDLYNFVPEKHVHETLDEDELKKIWNQQKNAFKKNKKAPLILIIFDDVISDENMKKSAMMKRLAVEGRHLNIAYFILTQYFNALPPIIRQNNDMAISFFLEREDDRNAIAGSYLAVHNQPVGRHIFERITKNEGVKYQAIIICNFKKEHEPEKFIYKYVASEKVPKFWVESELEKFNGGRQQVFEDNNQEGNYVSVNPKHFIRFMSEE